jgi:hypothetical protein
MKCPSCAHVQPDESLECPGCGVNFAKWKARAEGQTAAPAIKSSFEPSGAQETSFDLGGALKGAFVGSLAGIIESQVVALPFMKGSPRNMEEAVEMMKVLMTSMTYLMTDLVASLLCMAIGGYVATASGRSPVKQGGAAGVVMALVLAGMYSLSPVTTPGWYTAVIFILIVPAAIFGGMMR